MLEQVQVQKEDEQKEKLDKKYDEIQEFLQLLQEQDEEEALKHLKRLKKLGIVVAYAYHCKRCNHIWVPRDFDASFLYADFVNKTLEHQKPPKACARCKSRYWNLPPRRKTEHTIKDVDYETDHYRKSTGSSDKVEMFGHDMLTARRRRVMNRVTRKRLIELEKIEQKLDQQMKEYGFDHESISKRIEEELNIKYMWKWLEF